MQWKWPLFGLMALPIFTGCGSNNSSNDQGNIIFDDDFNGSSLPEAWIQIDGNPSNYAVANSNLNITNTDGGSVEGVWRFVRFRKTFRPDSDFLLFCSFDFRRDRYKHFDIALLDSNFEKILDFRLASTPTDWLGVGVGPCGDDMIRDPSHDPGFVEISYQGRSFAVQWDDSVYYQCDYNIEVHHLLLTFAQYVDDDDGFNTISIGRIWAERHMNGGIFPFF